MLAPIVRQKTFPPHELIIEQEDISSPEAFFIISGSVKVYRVTSDGNEVPIAVLGEGEVVGELALLDDQPRSANVETLQESVMLCLNRHDFMKVLSAHPQTAINLLKTLSVRVRENGKTLEDMYSLNLYERTWKTLKTLSSFFPNHDVNLSQEELATIIGATRARVTEVLNELKSQGKITLSHRRIKIF